MSVVKYREKHYFQISNVTIAIPPLDGVVYLLRPENEKKKKKGLSRHLDFVEVF